MKPALAVMNGGTMEDVAGVVAELVGSGNTLTVQVFDESGKPVPTKGFAASAPRGCGCEQGDRHSRRFRGERFGGHQQKCNCHRLDGYSDAQERRR